MDKLFEQYPYILFFIGCFFSLLENRNSKKQINSNIIVIYILFSIMSILGIGVFWKNLITILLLLFIELEILSASDKKDVLIVSARYKIINFMFNLIVKYKFIYILLINSLYSISYKYIYGKNVFIWYVCVIIFSILILKVIGKIYQCSFKFKEVEDIEEDYEKAMNGYTTFIEKSDNKNKLKLLLDIEDRTFEHRKNSYISFCWECLVYKIDKDYRKVDSLNSISSNKNKFIYIIKNLKSIILISYKIVCVIINSIATKKGLKRYLNRGYSTIEMQLIRTYGITAGYNRTYLRKIYELIYTNIFFKSYKRKNDHYNYLRSDEEFKNRILYAYLKSVKTFVNGFPVRNIYRYYKFIKEDNDDKVNKNNVLNYLTIEEIFIFILGLSRKEINLHILNYYHEYIEKYKMDEKKLKEVIGKIMSKTQKD